MGVFFYQKMGGVLEFLEKKIQNNRPNDKKSFVFLFLSDANYKMDL